MFPLCKTCTDTLNQNPCTHSEQERAILGTWCHVELMKAIEKGYQILKIHEVWHFPVHTDELFKEYVNKFLKIKQEASGYPKDCVTDEQKQQYIDEYYEHEGIRLDPNKIEYNPGLRSLAKLMLNSLWGMYNIYCFITSTLVSSVGRAWDCSEKKVDIPRSPVQFRNGGFDFNMYMKPKCYKIPYGISSSCTRLNLFLYIYREICTAIQPDQNRNGTRAQTFFRSFVLLRIRSM